jgi:PDZ domain-containing protein
MAPPQSSAVGTVAVPRPLGRGSRYWAVPLAAAAFVIVVAIVVTALLPAKLVAHKDVDRDGTAVSEETPYAVVPASVQAVADRVSYRDLGADVAVDLDPDGRVFFVTVRDPAQSVLGWFVAEDVPDVRFMTYEEKYGTRTPSQQRTIALHMMRTSSQVAQYVALQLAGFDPELVPGPVQIGELLDAPSADQLEVGDTVMAVDGTTIDTIDDLTGALADKRPGDTVSITVDREEAGEVELDVTLTESPDEPGRAIIGFVPFDTTSVRLPFEIAFDTGQIGGPSAGLAFALTLLDELTAGDLLGGEDVAVTGTIDIDGTVGAIGGLPQKVSAVRQAGIEHFLVPEGNPEIDTALEVAGDDVELIPVATVDEALAALERLGGDPLPAQQTD